MKLEDGYYTEDQIAHNLELIKLTEDSVSELVFTRTVRRKIPDCYHYRKMYKCMKKEVIEMNFEEATDYMNKMVEDHGYGVLCEDFFGWKYYFALGGCLGDSCHYQDGESTDYFKQEYFRVKSELFGVLMEMNLGPKWD